MTRKENSGKIGTNSLGLDNVSGFAIVMLAKTTRSDPFGHGGF